MPTREKKSSTKKHSYAVPKHVADTLKEDLKRLNDGKLTDLRFSYYLSILDRLHKEKDEYHEGFVPMSTHVMKVTLNSNYKKYLTDLEILGIIEAKMYNSTQALYSSRGGVAKKYRYTDRYRSGEFKKIQGIIKYKLGDRNMDLDVKYTASKLSNSKCPEYKHILQWLRQISFDEDAVRRDCSSWLETGALVKGKPFTKERHDDYVEKCLSFNSADKKIKIGSTLRVWTNLANVPSALRRHMKVAGYTGQLYYSDLISAHLLLAVPEMRKFGETEEEKQEMRGVIRMIGSGRFYKTVSDKLRDKGVEVLDEKKDFLSNIWNDDKHYSAYFKVIKKLYPTFHKFIQSQKHGKSGNSSFYRKLTKTETKLFNERIIRRIVRELGEGTFVIGVYDSLIYKEEDRAAIERILEEEVYKHSKLRHMFRTTTLDKESLRKVTVPGEPTAHLTSSGTAKVLPGPEQRQASALTLPTADAKPAVEAMKKGMMSAPFLSAPVVKKPFVPVDSYYVNSVLHFRWTVADAYRYMAYENRLEGKTEEYIYENLKVEYEWYFTHRGAWECICRWDGLPGNTVYEPEIPENELPPFDVLYQQFKLQSKMTA